MDKQDEIELHQKISESNENTRRMLAELHGLTQRLNGQVDLFKWIVTGIFAGVVSLVLLFFSNLLEVREQISQSNLLIAKLEGKLDRVIDEIKSKSSNP